MAVGTLAEWDPGVAGLVIGAGGVTLLAGHLRVQSGQRVAGLGVIELAHGDSFPVGVVVALETIRAQPSVVRILMAGDATRRDAQKSIVQILDFDRRALSLGDTLGGMTSIAGESCVFTLKGVSRLLVVECFRVPLDEREVLTIVFGVTARALLARTRLDVVGSV